jgi:hypothetical protein
VTPYEYFSVLVSVVVGLAVSDLTISLHKLLAAGGRVRWHWATPAVGLLSGVLVLGEFLSVWFARDEEVHFPRVLASTGLLVLLFLAVAAALPDEVPEEGLDLRAYYFENRRHFWGLMAIFMSVQTVIIAVNPVNQSASDFLLIVAQDAAVAVVCVSLIFIRQAWWHALWIPVFLGLELLNWWHLELS